MSAKTLHHRTRFFGRFFLLIICIFAAFLQPAFGARKKQKDPLPPAVKGIDVAKEINAKSLTEASANGLRVMILCDSMGMSGFAEQLDACFRSCPGVASVHTFAACGSNPLTWMKMAPYANATTRCGYMRIETKAHDSGTRVEREFKGMINRNAKGQRVPKIEDLIPSIKPDILVIQNGNNFFGNFNSRRPIGESQGKVIRGHVSPMIKWLTTKADTTRKLYWVTPPQAGNISPEAQQFIYDSIHSQVQGVGTMIDSRTLTSFPYPSQSKDKMHFSGKEATDWGTSTFRIIATDIAKSPVANAPSLTSLRPQENKTTEVAKSPETQKSGNQITLRVRLKKSTTVPKPETFAPYGEFLITNLYTVTSVINGDYKEKEIAIKHPAYIKHRKQDLSRFKKKKNLTVNVIEPSEESPWNTVNSADTVASPEHTIYMLSEDLNRHPESEDCAACESQQKTNSH